MDFIDTPLIRHWTIDCNSLVFFDNMTQKIKLKIKMKLKKKVEIGQHAKIFQQKLL